MAITLRTFADGDLDALFTWESDRRAVQMAAFTKLGTKDSIGPVLRNDP
jgi:hypothetical protein